ncbi:hypothetical protein ZIOFF_024115 [Zingiber officinale]|uniref:BED-type domain-containing protein n=1 Tax=Zingiber officinale TaxID=94328 RepID=A0A8J5GXS9_ZINOF|nr:hypothetical protein ZIOFF_024115 [Zingiber officinale]
MRDGGMVGGLFLSWRRPTKEQEQACIASSGGFNYDPKFHGSTTSPHSRGQKSIEAVVGEAEGTLTENGFSINHARVLLGSGPRTFDLAKSALLSWKHFGLGWAFVNPKTPVEKGERFCVCVKEVIPWMMMPLQIAYVREDTGGLSLNKASFSFGSGTLRGHLLLEFAMSTNLSKKDKKDIGWKYCYQNEGEKAVRCKFCHHISNGGITRLKEHLAQTHKGVAPCVSVPDDIKKEIRESLDKIRASKSKQTELLREIGEGPQSMSTQSSKVGSVGGNSIGCSGSGESKVDEINSDDEWITEKEGPVLPVTTKWLEDDELFESDPIVSVPSATFESLFDSDKRVEDVEDIVEVPPTNSKKRVAENSSGSKDKQARLSLVDVEDNHLDAENYGVIPTFDSGNFPTIDTIDDDSDIELDDTDYF